VIIDRSSVKTFGGRTTSFEVFSVINIHLEENEISWENSTGLCTDETQ